MNWENKGCESCRNWWIQGTYPSSIAASQIRKATLYYCQNCLSYWEMNERFADVISEEEVKEHYLGII